ncbi:MAG: hypothetical protein ACYDEJ_03085 [Desulfitobacteriaceae bacterium]
MSNDLRARLRHRQDRDIKRGLQLLEEQCPNKQLEQGELSDLIRDGVRLILLQKGVLPIRDELLRSPSVERCGTPVERCGKGAPDAVPQTENNTKEDIAKPRTIRKLAVHTN